MICNAYFLIELVYWLICLWGHMIHNSGMQKDGGRLASNPDFPFWILSHSFRGKSVFLQSCKTKPGTESLGLRLGGGYNWWQLSNTSSQLRSSNMNILSCIGSLWVKLSVVPRLKSVWVADCGRWLRTMLSNVNLRSSTVAIEGGLCASSMLPCQPSWCQGQLLVRSFCYKTHFPSLCTVYVFKEILTRWRN